MSSSPRSIRACIPAWSEWKNLSPSADNGDDESQEVSRSREDFSAFLLSSMQMQNLLVLAGSGTSLNAGGPRMSDLWGACVGAGSDLADEVLTKVRYGKESNEDNIEELLSRCDALLQFDEHASIARFRANAIDKILELCRRPGTANYGSLASHREFLRRLARRRARDTRLKLFTTNYDRCFDLAAGSLGLVAINGFSFANPRRFDPRFFEYDIVNRATGAQDASAFIAGVFHYYKLHGSVDWQFDGPVITVEPSVGADAAALIYPASTKFKTSFRQPHLELMAQYLAALRQPNTCLIVVGFGFNDSHLSEPILAALDTNPHLRMVIVSPGVESKIESPEDNQIWSRFAEAAGRGADIAFVAAEFEKFVTLIPDLRALSPAERLYSAVGDVVR